MDGEREVAVARVRCPECAADTFAVVGTEPAPCPLCGSPRTVTETFGDRRAGADRRAPSRLQRRWDVDPRSWFDRRRA